MVEGLIGFLMRVGLMLMSVSVFAGLAAWCFNRLGLDYTINYWQAWAALTMVGCIRFVWSFDEVI